jgi:hypothetical protein
VTRRAAVAVTLVPSICTIGAASTAPSAVRRAAPATADGDGRGVRTARARRVAGEERPSAPPHRPNLGDQRRGRPSSQHRHQHRGECHQHSSLAPAHRPSCGKDAPDAREDCPAGATGEGPPLPARDWRVQDLIVDGSGLGGVHVPGGRTPLERFALQAGQGPTAALRLGQRAGDDGPGDDTVRSLPPPVLDGGPPCPCPCSCPWSSLGGFFLGFAAPGSRSWQ